LNLTYLKVHTLIVGIARRFPVVYKVQKSIGLPMGAQEPQVCRSGWEEDVSDERHCFEDEYERKLTAASRVGAIERYFFVLESSRRFCRASDLQSLTE
jgi:hypothetical protein